MSHTGGMETVTWSSFLGRTGQALSLLTDDGERAAEIAEVARTDNPLGGTLSVMVAVPDGAPAQGTYLLRHAELGEFPLFLVPRSPTQVEVVFTWLDAP